MKTLFRFSIIAASVLLIVGCDSGPETSQKFAFAVTEADIAHHLESHEGVTREQAIAQLEARARAANAAIQAGVGEDPVTRAEIARILSSRHRELVLNPKLKSEFDGITDSQLRKVYDQRRDEFVKPERRQAAVLWLDPGKDPKRRAGYLQKMENAITWLQDHAIRPEDGFSSLGIDHSQHAASRFNGGVIGWLTAGEESDEWTRTIARAAFAIEQAGFTSDVITTNQGIFLVRLMAIDPGCTMPFETAKAELARERKQQIERMLTEEFAESKLGCR